MKIIPSLVLASLSSIALYYAMTKPMECAQFYATALFGALTSLILIAWDGK